MTGRDVVKQSNGEGEADGWALGQEVTRMHNAKADPLPVETVHVTARSQALKLAACTLAVYACFGGYAVLQERISREPYDGETWQYPWALLVCTAACNTLVAAVTLQVQQPKPLSVAGRVRFLQVAVPYICAMWASSAALKYVDYPTAVLGKSCKPLAVMLVSIIVHRKRYPSRKYVSVVLLTLGISAFFLMADKRRSDTQTSPTGLALLATSLLMDGAYGPLQDRLIKSERPTPTQLMFYMNIWSLPLIAGAMLMSGQADDALAFAHRHPAVLWNIAQFAVLSALGQNIIMYTVHAFGSLVLSTVTTTRKFFTILASVVLFRHQLAPAQWAGVLIVFSGLGYDIFKSWQESKRAEAAAGTKKHA